MQALDDHKYLALGRSLAELGRDMPSNSIAVEPYQKLLADFCQRTCALLAAESNHDAMSAMLMALEDVWRSASRFLSQNAFEVGFPCSSPLSVLCFTRPLTQSLAALRSIGRNSAASTHH